MDKRPTIVVFSHLRWNWVWQRPQHLLSRLAKLFPVIVIEEPLPCEHQQSPHWRFERPADSVLVCTPYTAIDTPGFNGSQLPELGHLLDNLVEQEALHDILVWLYTPMALPLARRLKPLAMVYDVMDELSAFKGAPPELLEWEAEAYRCVDLVFTGGTSLYRTKRNRHPNVHCFPSSVDAAHFGKARNAALDHGEQSSLPQPRLGFFGVIDERIDLQLLDKMARERPEWQLIMVGPVTKIDPDELPRHPNLHYLGQQDYNQLPAFLASWDICLLPFANNESTRYISPTKTLEYMAAEKPIVSTPITDVVEPYGDIVYIGDSADAFIAACDRALAESSEQFNPRLTGMRKVLLSTSWDITARAMAKEIAKIRQGQGPLALARTRAQKERAKVAVIGAGPTGLSAVYHSPDSVLLEANDTVGGWCRSIEENGFTFDYAGHIMFSNDPYVHEMYRKLLGDNVHWQDREAWIYSKGVHTRYPFQGALYGLPPDVIKECVVGAIEARFGPLKSTENKGPERLRDQDCKHAGDVKDCCGDGVLESTVRLVARNAASKTSGEPYANFEEFIYKVWGAGVAKHFAVPYNRKLWGVDLKNMETSWLGGRVPLPDLEEMIEGALRPIPKPMGPNARFGYPLRGGFQALMDGFLPHIKDRLRLNAEVVSISQSLHRVTLANGATVEYGHLISTMPLPVLLRRLSGDVPARIRQAAENLQHISVKCVNLGVGRPNLTEKHWIYYPEDTVFHRIFVQGNASPHCNPAGGFGLTCEITYGPDKPLPCDGDALIEQCISDCHKVGIFSPEDPIWAANLVDMPHAYVIYDHHRAQNVKLIRDWLAERDIILAGRYSEWEYYNSDHAFLAGKRAADTVRELQNKRIAASDRLGQG
jgi:UDP-galactopyranose mutase